MSIIEFQQFTCLRDEMPLFQPLSFIAQAGDIIQVAGPNGAGKTTFLRTLSGLYDQFQGNWLWNGEPAAKMAYERALGMMYFGHHPGVKGVLTVVENLRWFAGIHQADSSHIDQALAAVGLTGYEDTLCQQMSAGQQRRVALARLYLSNAEVWVLDEPFTAIDTQGVAILEAHLERHASRGGTVILTSHQTVACKGLRCIALDPVREHAQ